MMGAPNNYDEETAHKTCTKLEQRLEGREVFRVLKAQGNRRVVAQYVHVEGVDLANDVIPNHRVKEALEDLKARDPRYHNVMWRHTSYQIGHPLWSFTDEEGVQHKTEVDEYGLWGITEIRNDGYVTADKMWSDILAGKSMGASVGVMSVDGNPLKPVILSKDELVKRKLPSRYLNARYYDQPLQFIEPWSFTPQPMNQNVTNIMVLAKEICEPCVKARAEWYLKKGVCETMTEALARARVFFEKYNEQELAKSGNCDLERCQGACCTFMTQWETRKDKDFKSYLRLHNVQFKEVHNGLWLKLPVPCQAFNQQTKLCTAYDKRPNICRVYPRRESPFIKKEDCSLLMSRLGTKPFLAKSVEEDTCKEDEVLDPETGECIPNPAPEDVRDAKAEINKDLKDEVHEILLRHGFNKLRRE